MRYEKISLVNLITCENCGVVFDYTFEQNKEYDRLISICPLCKKQQEIKQE